MVALPRLSRTIRQPRISSRDGNFNATFLAGSDIDPDVHIAGNFVGRDGVGGRGLVSAAAYLGATFAAPNNLVLTGTIVGDFVGSLNSGAFVPFDNSGDSPFNPNDVGPMQAGTVLTLGDLDVDIDVGRIRGGNNGVVGGDGITFGEAMTGTESLADRTFLGTTTFSSTHDSVFDVNVIGRPWSPVLGQSGPGTVTPNPADGDGENISVLSFGAVNGQFTFEDSGDFNFVMANVDAITAIDTSGASPGDPMDPATTLPFNAGESGGGIGEDMNLSATAVGSGEGGLEVEVLAAGLDPFTRIDTAGAAPTGLQVPVNSLAQAPKTPDFWSSWGDSEISTSAVWTAMDADPTNGLEVGDLTFALIGAGEEIDGGFIAQDDIIARTSGVAGTDETPLAPNSLDADVAAGLRANSGINPLGESDLFDGGWIGSEFVAGDDIGSEDADALILMTAQAGPNDDNPNPNEGDFTSDFTLVSGAEDQLASDSLFDNFTGWPTTELEPDPDAGAGSNISALLIAGKDVQAGALIDAGDVTSSFGGVTGGGLGEDSAMVDDSFRGGIHTGAGVDLDLMTVADNDEDGDMLGTVRATSDIDASDMDGITLGILAEGDIDTLTAGYGVEGGSILGDIIAEDDIISLIAATDIGEEGDLIMAKDDIGIVQAGNPVGGVDEVLDSEVMIGSFGEINSDIFVGSGFYASGQQGLPVDGFIGAGAAINGNIAMGTADGIGSNTNSTVSLIVGADDDAYDVDAGLWMMFVEGGELEGQFGAVDMIINQGDTDVDVTVDSNGTGDGASVRSMLFGDTVTDGSAIDIEDGSLGWLGVADDVPGLSAFIDSHLASLGFDFATLPEFFTNSIPTEGAVEETFNDDEPKINFEGDISVSDEFGIADGLHTAIDPAVQGPLAGIVDNGSGTNADFYIEGDLLADVSDVDIIVHNGDMGDVWVGNDIIADPQDILLQAEGSIGEVVADNDIILNDGDLTLNAVTGSLGGLVAAHGGLSSEGDNVSLMAYGSIGESDWNENGTVEAAEDLNGDGFITPALAVAEGGINQGTVTLQSTAGDVGDIIAEEGIDSTLDIDAMSGNVGKIHSRTGDILGVDVRAGGSFLGMIAENGWIGAQQSNATDIHVEENVGQLYASSGIDANVLAERGNVGLETDITLASGDVVTMAGGNVYTETGNVTGTITAGGSVGDVVAPTGQLVSLDIVARNDVGSLYGANGISDALVEAKTGDVAVANNPAEKTIYGFVWCQPLPLIKTASTGAPEAGISAQTGNIDTLEVDAAGSIGPVTAFLNNLVDVDLQAGMDLGLITAGNDISDLDLQAGGDADGVVAGDDLTDFQIDVEGRIEELTAGDDLGSDADRTLVDAGSIGIVSAVNDIVDLDLQVAGDADGIEAGDDVVDLNADIEGELSHVQAGDTISGADIAAQSLGELRATGVASETSSIEDVLVTVIEDVDTVYAYSDIGDETEDTSVTIMAGGNIGAVGGVTADVGAIHSDVGITADVDIGLVTASGNIEGTYIAQTGSIGNGAAAFVSSEGDIDIVATAGQDIDAIIAETGNILGEATIEDLSQVGTVVTGVTGELTAGGDIGPITAAGDIGNYQITARGTVDSITAESGSVGSGIQAIVDVIRQTGNASTGQPIFTTFQELRDVGQLMVEAGEIGAITAGQNINGEYVVQGSVGDFTAGSNIGLNGLQDMVVTSGASVGSMTATTGAIGDVTVHAVDSIGAVQASLDVAGEYIAEEGDIGDGTSAFTSTAGDLDVVASAGTDMDGVSARDISGSLTVGGDLAAVDASRNISGLEVDVDGDAATISAGKDVLSLTADVEGDLTSVDAAEDIDGLILDAGSLSGGLAAGKAINDVDATVSQEVGDISAGTDIGTADETTVTVISGLSIGDVSAHAGAIGQIDLTAHDSIGAVTASGDIYGSYTAETGSIGDGTAAFASDEGDVDVEATAGTDIDAVDARDISGSLTAEGDLAAVTAVGDVDNLTIDVEGDAAAISAGNDIWYLGVDVEGDVASIDAGDDIYDVDLEAGSVTGGLSAGENIDYVDAMVAEDMGDITAAADIGSLIVRAGGDIGNVTAETGEIMGDITEVELAMAMDVPLGLVTGDISPLDVEGLGSVDLAVSGVNAMLKAGGDIGDISAQQDIGNFIIEADGSVGGITSTTGSVGGESQFTIPFFGLPDLAIESGALSITAGADVGDITSAKDIGSASAMTVNLMGVEVTLEGGWVDVTSTTGEVGDITSQTGSIVNMDATAVTAMGDVSAAENIHGSYMVTEGALGDMNTTNGDIGSAESPVVISANGGVEIDPVTLQYDITVVDPTINGSVGTIVAELGDIYLDLEAGTSVGLIEDADATPGDDDGQILGGIAAPQGMIDATLAVGGHVGGLSAQSVDLDPESVVMGSIGILRGVENGGGSVASIDENNPLIITSADVDYRVVVDSGTAAVQYSVVAGVVTFDQITYNAVGASAGIHVMTTHGGRTAGSPTDADDMVTVHDMDVNGDVANIAVEGDLLDLSVDGNMAGGTLAVEGALGNVHVMGDFGSANTDSNPFAADDMALEVDEFDSSIFSMDVEGTNYGLVQTTVESGEWISWENTLDFNDEGDDIITVFVGNGTADLRVNNGFLEKMELANGWAQNVAVLTSDQDFEDDTDDTDPTGITSIATWEAWLELTNQVALTDQALNQYTSDIQNQVFEAGSGSVGDNDTAHVGRIVAEGGSGFWFGDAVVEGDVAQVNASNLRGSVWNITTADDLDEVLAKYSVSNLDVRGDLGVVDTDNLFGVEVNGDAEQIQSTYAAIDINVQGNAGRINAGEVLWNVTVDGDAASISSGGGMGQVKVGGDMLKLSAQWMDKISVGGSIGFSENDDLDLGRNFSRDQVESILGDDDGDIARGGVQADYLGRVSVSGSIGDLTITQNGQGADSLLNSTVDDAFVREGWSGNLIKQDGELVEWPEMSTEQILAELGVDLEGDIDVN
jgi:hypothetical protein